MSELDKLAKQLETLQNSLEKGLALTLSSIPIHTKKFAERDVKRKLQTTSGYYLDRLKVGYKDNYVLVVSLDTSSEDGKSKEWLIDALESGASAFDMKEGLLKTAKISKFGFRYKVIPLPKDKNRTPAANDESRAFQERINAVLAKPKFGELATSGPWQLQKVITNDSELKSGFYRFQKKGSKKGTKWDYVLFRTVSDSPYAKGKWQHPGITGIRGLQTISRWLDAAIPDLFDKMFKQAMKESGFTP